MADTSSTTPVAGTLTTALSTAFSALATGAVAGIKTLPHWAAAAILSILGLWSFGVIDLTPRDTISKTQMEGIAASLKTVASKADIEELKALIAYEQRPAASAVTTGSITKPKR
jgi:putative Mn2+ efflux pump MntP